MLIQTLSKVIGFKLLVLLLVSPSIAGINECESEYKARNYNKAHLECNSQFLQQNGRARFIIGSMWEEGQGVNNPSREISCRTFLESARLDHCEAYIKTSQCYRDQKKPLQDVEKWLLKAKECKSLKKSNFEKGKKAFDDGKFFTAINFLMPFADQKNSDAQYIVGKSYFYSGEDDLAEKYLKLSAENNNIDAIKLLNKYFSLKVEGNNQKVEGNNQKVEGNNQKVEGDYEKGLDAYKKKNYKVSLKEWIPFANNNPNNSNVQYYLGLMYLNGYGIDKNYREAAYWFKKADKLNNKFAQYNLGIMHSNGNGLSKSDLYTYYFFKKSADQNYDEAQYKLARLYFHGNGVTKNLNLAKKWATKSANQGNTEAKKLLKEIEKRIAPTSLDFPSEQSSISHYDIGRLYESKGSIYSSFYWYLRATLAQEKRAKGALLMLMKKNIVNISIGLIVLLITFLSLRSNSKKKALKEKYKKDQQEIEENSKEKEEKEEKAQEERNTKAKQAREDKAKKDQKIAEQEALKAKAKKIKAEVQRKAEEAKTKKDREDGAKKSKEEELDKYILAAEAKSQNEKLDKARKKIESENKGVVKKDNKAKSKKVKPKKVQKVDAIKPRPKFRNPEKKRFQIVELVIGGSKWIKWRHSGVGSSDAAKVLSNKSSELLKLKNNKTDNAHSEELKLSSDILQKARCEYEEEIGLKVFPLCIQDNRFPWLMATIDGFSQDFGKLIKISYTELEYKDAKKGLYPRSLIQHQLMITGLEEIDYYCYLENQKSILITVKRDQKIIDKLYQAELAFAEKLSS